jgi:hypothetical protein
MSLTAQEEVDRLFNQKEKISSHPEDRDRDSIHSSDDDDENHGGSGGDSDLDFATANHNNTNMISKNPSYHIPTTVYDANTGPKGVIADAQAYERARKRSFRKTLFNVTGIDFSSSKNEQVIGAQQKQKPSSSRGSSSDGDVDDDDEEFMRKWRQSRMQELQEGKRRVSPSKRTFGKVDVVDANGYLDAVEKVTADTVVVVCIYDPEVCSPFPLFFPIYLHFSLYNTNKETVQLQRNRRRLPHPPRPQIQHNPLRKTPPRRRRHGKHLRPRPAGL